MNEYLCSLFSKQCSSSNHFDNLSDNNCLLFKTDLHGKNIQISALTGCNLRNF